MQSCTVTWLNDTHTRTDTHSQAKVSVFFLTHGGTFSIFGVFWHGITHGRTRLLHKPAPLMDIGSVIISHVGCVFQISYDRPVTGSELGEGTEAKQISTFLLRLFRQDSTLIGVFRNKIKIPNSPASHREMC